MTRDERQQQIVDKWKTVKRGSVVCVPGFGKTRISLMIIKQLAINNLNLTVLVVVPSDNLKDQWIKQLIEWELIQYVDVMIINTAVREQRDYKLLILDECHGYVSETFKLVFDNIKYKGLLCLTGTMDRLDGKEELIKLHAPVFDEVTMEEALVNKWIADYIQYKVFITVDLTEYKKHNAKFMSHFAFFDYNFDLAMKCATDNNFRFAYANRSGLQVRDIVIHGMGFMREMKARKEFIYNHPKKIEIANLILHAREDKKVVTFSKTVAAAKELCCGDIYHSGMNKKKRAELLEKFNNQETGVLHTAKALDVGSDVQGLEVAIILTGDSSSITKRQKFGRINRKEGEKVSELFHFVIKGTVEEAWFAKASGSMRHTDIDELQLIRLLETGSIEKKIHKETKFLFRF